MNKIIPAIFLLLWTSFPLAADSLTVILSGETHAMLHPCDCPVEPGGGLAQRAGLLKKYNRDVTLLLDAGGFSAGGMYDTYSQGRKNDSIRTVQTIASMGVMGYDAVALGDDDFQYGGNWLAERAKKEKLPLVSANSFKKDGSYLVSPYLLVKKRGKTFAITSVVTTEKLLQLDNEVRIEDPRSSLQKIYKEIKEKSDYQVLISHLGEEETSALLKGFPDLLLAANGHRKVTPDPLFSVHKIPVLNFGFQGKALSYVGMKFTGKQVSFGKSGWLKIDEGLGEDRQVATILSQKMDQEARVYDLYIMSMCPYGLQALADLTGLLRAFPQTEWNIWFIGSAQGDNLSSLRGEDEMSDEMLWLAVSSLYPQRYAEFLFKRASSREPTAAILQEMELDMQKITSWVAAEGKNELRNHYLRSMRLKIDASPTVLVNNLPYDKSTGNGRLVWEECKTAQDKPAFCNEIPECIDDSDCKAKGKLGSCAGGDDGEKPRCVFKDDVQFGMTVVVADSSIASPESDVIRATEEMFPAVQIEKVTLSSKKGQEIIAKFKPDALPFFVVDREASGAQNFASIKSVLEERDGLFVFKNGSVRTNFYPQRAVKKGYDLYVDPLMGDIGKVIDVVLKTKADVRVKPVMPKSPLEKSSLAEDKLRQEESLRWLVLAEQYPAQFKAYLQLYAKDPGTSYWYLWLDELKINPKEFLKKVKASEKLLKDNWDALSGLYIRDPVVLVRNNRETIVASGENDLERLLQTVAKK